MYVITVDVAIFYPIDTKFGVVNSKVQFEDGPCGSIETPREHHQKINIRITFQPQL